jgi:hypothetical protein
MISSIQLLAAFIAASVVLFSHFVLRHLLAVMATSRSPLVHEESGSSYSSFGEDFEDALPTPSISMPLVAMSPSQLDFSGAFPTVDILNQLLRCTFSKECHPIYEFVFTRSLLLPGDLIVYTVDPRSDATIADTSAEYLRTIAFTEWTPLPFKIGHRRPLVLLNCMPDNQNGVIHDLQNYYAISQLAHVVPDAASRFHQEVNLHQRPSSRNQLTGTYRSSDDIHHAPLGLLSHLLFGQCALVLISQDSSTWHYALPAVLLHIFFPASYRLLIDDDAHSSLIRRVCHSRVTFKYAGKCQSGPDTIEKPLSIHKFIHLPHLQGLPLPVLPVQ